MNELDIETDDENERSLIKECLQINSIRKFKFSPLICRFSHKLNPLYTPENINKWSKQQFQYSLMDKSRYEKYKNCGLWAGYFHHSTDPDIYECIMLYSYIYFYFDDHCENENGDIAKNIEKTKLICGQYEEVFEKLISEKYISMLYWKPYVTALYIVCERIFQKLNIIQQRRFCNAHKIFYNGYTEEAIYHDTIDKINDMEQYYKVRSNSIASQPCFAMLEYDLQIFLTEEDFNNKKFKHLKSLWTRINILLNDLYSYEKESHQYKGRENKMWNCVQVFARIESIDIEESMRRVIKMIYEIESEMIAIRDEFYDDINTSEEMKTYINALEYGVGGVIISHQLMDRYNKF